MAILRNALALGLILTVAGCNLTSSRMSNELGKLQYRRGNYTAARWDFQRAAIEDPDNADAWHNLATTLKKQGDLAGAELTYRRALTSDPSHQPSYHGLADLLSLQGRHREGFALLNGWRNVEPYTARPHIEMAWLQQSVGDMAGAEQSLWQAMRVQPNHPTTLAHLGQIYHRTGRPVEAVAMYRRSLFANWNQPAVQSRLASLDPTFNRIGPPPATLMAARPVTVAFGPVVSGFPAPVQAVAATVPPASTAAAFQSTVVTPERLAGVPSASYLPPAEDADPAHGQPGWEMPAGDPN